MYNLSKESKNFSNESLDSPIKKDKKLLTWLKEDKEAINAFISKKSKRFEKYIRKKRDIKLQRIKEDFDILSKRVKEDFCLMEKRIKEDIKMEEEMMMIQLQEEFERRTFNEKLNFKFSDKLKNKRTLSLKEESDGDDAEEAIIGIKKVNQEKYFDLIEE